MMNAMQCNAVLTSVEKLKGLTGRERRNPGTDRI